MSYKIGTIHNVVISGIQPYGAFVSLDNHTQGLIHVSEIQAGYTKNINEVLKVGDQVEVQVIDIDEFSKKISLSLRTLSDAFPITYSKRKKYFTNRNRKIGFASLAKALPKWIKEDLSYLAENHD